MKVGRYVSEGGIMGRAKRVDTDCQLCFNSYHVCILQQSKDEGACERAERAGREKGEGRQTTRRIEGRMKANVGDRWGGRGQGGGGGDGRKVDGRQWNVFLCGDLDYFKMVSVSNSGWLKYRVYMSAATHSTPHVRLETTRRRSCWTMYFIETTNNDHQ